MKCDACGEIVNDFVTICPKCNNNFKNENTYIQSDNSGIAIGGNVHGDVLGSGAKKEINIYLEKKTINKEALKRSYLNYLFETSRRLSLSGAFVSSTGSSAIDLNLDSVYTALECVEIKNNTLVDDANLSFEDNISALEALDSNNKIVFLGEPGSGKTTFVNFVTLCMTGELLNDPRVNIQLLTKPLPEKFKTESQVKQNWSHGALLPLRIVLREFIQNLLSKNEKETDFELKDLWEYIYDELKNIELGEYFYFLQQELIEIGGMILFDGIDEIPDVKDFRKNVIKIIENLSNSLPKCSFLVTSRTYSYQNQDFKIRNFAVKVISPFNKNQIRSFVYQWYRYIGLSQNLHLQDIEIRSEQLHQFIVNNTNIQSLAKRPLLLTLISAIHAWRGGRLPEKKEELLYQAVDLLLSFWENEKTTINPKGERLILQPSLTEFLSIGQNEVLSVLSKIAYTVHVLHDDMKNVANIPETELITGLINASANPLDLRPARLIEYLSSRAGLILPRGNKVYVFPHRTFQEYLAAYYLTEDNFPDKVANLAREDPERWREVVLFAGAKAARGTKFAMWSLVDALCFKTIDAMKTEVADVWGSWFAGQLLYEVGDIDKVSNYNEIKLERVKKWQQYIVQLDSFPSQERVASGRVLGLLGDERVGVCSLDDFGYPSLQMCLVPEGEFLMGSRDDDEFAHINEKPLHIVNLPSFSISKYLVTNFHFNLFVIGGGYKNERYWLEAVNDGCWKDGFIRGRYDLKERNQPIDYGSPYNLPNHPVTGITWYEALAFCRWLTESFRFIGKINLDEEFTLPTEAQWEKASRGVDGRIFPWGNDPDIDKANVEETGIGATSAVGCFPLGASPYGVHDMAGNVREWTISLWGEGFDDLKYGYPYSFNDGREDLSANKNYMRVLRGGLFRDSIKVARCASRFRFGPESKNRRIGFRVVKIRR